LVGSVVLEFLNYLGILAREKRFAHFKGSKVAPNSLAA
jgi:hypothetical protein